MLGPDGGRGRLRLQGLLRRAGGRARRRDDRGRDGRLPLAPAAPAAGGVRPQPAAGPRRSRCSRSGAPRGLLVAAFVVAGAGLSLFDVWWQTALAQRIPPHALSRVSSYDWMGSLALLPLGYLLAGPIGEAIGATEVLIVGGALGLAVSAARIRHPRRLAVARDFLQPVRVGSDHERPAHIRAARSLAACLAAAGPARAATSAVTEHRRLPLRFLRSRRRHGPASVHQPRRRSRRRTPAPTPRTTSC